VNVEFNQQNWSVQVKDQGAGIAESDIEKIFEPFYCVEDIKHRSTKGVGLGLYLCQKIAQAHDGSLIVESEINQGSCFTLVIPHFQS
jgi:signal transduction histidine kinase